MEQVLTSEWRPGSPPRSQSETRPGPCSVSGPCAPRTYPSPSGSGARQRWGVQKLPEGWYLWLSDLTIYRHLSLFAHTTIDRIVPVIMKMKVIFGCLWPLSTTTTSSPRFAAAEARPYLWEESTTVVYTVVWQNSVIWWSRRITVPWLAMIAFMCVRPLWITVCNQSQRRILP